MTDLIRNCSRWKQKRIAKCHTGSRDHKDLMRFCAEYHDQDIAASQHKVNDIGSPFKELRPVTVMIAVSTHYYVERIFRVRPGDLRLIIFCISVCVKIYAGFLGK